MNRGAKFNPKKRMRMAERRADPEYRARERDLKYRRRYGLTLAEYDTILAAQGGVCAICNRLSKVQLGVDHCHKTGKVRGLLCWSCNTKLGWVEKYLPQIASYLRRHK